jgi:hypothetical protein
MLFYKFIWTYIFGNIQVTKDKDNFIFFDTILWDLQELLSILYGLPKIIEVVHPFYSEILYSRSFKPLSISVYWSYIEEIVAYFCEEYDNTGTLSIETRRYRRGGISRLEHYMLACLVSIKLHVWKLWYAFGLWSSHLCHVKKVDQFEFI